MGFLINDKFLKSLFLLLLVSFVTKFIKRVVTNTIKKHKKINNRFETLCMIFLNSFCYILYFLVTTEIVRDLFDIKLTTIFAATGVVGVTIGFGTQNLIKDVISGFFIMLEDQYSVGEVVTIEKFTGKVMELGIRCTRLKNEFGDIFIIPNGLISMIINHSRCEKKIKIEVPVSHKEQISSVFDALEEISSIAKNELDCLLDKPEILGISRIGSRNVGVQLILTCGAGNEKLARYKFFKLIKEKFDEKNIFLCER